MHVVPIQNLLVAGVDSYIASKQKHLGVTIESVTVRPRSYEINSTKAMQEVCESAKLNHCMKKSVN